MEKTCLLILVISAPSLAMEKYLRLESAVNEPNPLKLVIYQDGFVDFTPTAPNLWEMHAEDDFCNLSHNLMDSNGGTSVVYCFDRHKLRMFETYTSFKERARHAAPRSDHNIYRCFSTE